jgi:hypothetical protein
MENEHGYTDISKGCGKYDFIKIMLMDGKYSDDFSDHLKKCSLCRSTINRLDTLGRKMEHRNAEDDLVMLGIEGAHPSSELLMYYNGDYDGLVKDEYLLTDEQREIIKKHVSKCGQCAHALEFMRLDDDAMNRLN